MITTGAVVDFLETLAPLHLAAPWDNVGLLLGRRDVEVRQIMTCLTVTSQTVAEAVEAKVELVVSHHPIFFHAGKRLTAATPEERMLLDLAQAGAAVFSAHTAFDNAVGGINDQIARRLQLRDVAPLRSREEAQEFKLVVFVPPVDLQRVSDALFNAGAGRIGQYNECSFRLAGTGTFFGTESTKPTVGRKGQREEVSEWRLECVCPAARLAEAIARMRQAHSYEEPAFDVYPLAKLPSNHGEGRVGQLPEPLGLGDFASAVKTSLRASAVQLVGDPTGPIRRVAVVCGSGGEFIPDAIRAKAGVLLTGEARFHDSLAAEAAGLALVLPGHFSTERLGMEDLALRLHSQFPELVVWASRREQDPLVWL